CTIHELPSTSAPQLRRFVITALKAGSTWIFAELAAPGYKGIVAGTMFVQVTGSKHGIRLMFFPGERSVNYSKTKSATVGMIYVVGGNGERYSAAGGPQVGSVNPADGGHTAE